MNEGPTVVYLDPEAAAAVWLNDEFLNAEYDSVIAPDGSMTAYIPSTTAVIAARPCDVTRINLKGHEVPIEWSDRSE